MEVDLDTQMATLEINAKKRRHSSNFSAQLPTTSQEENNDPETISPRRSTRKKSKSSVSQKRRVERAPLKLSENSSLKEIHNYYLSKSIKRLTPSLETIFEEPQQGKNNEISYMSNRKFRRFINFNNSASLKTKKRTLKAKQLPKLNASKISMECFLENFKSLDERDDGKPEQ